VEAPEVVTATSVEDAVSSFGDGTGVTVLAGGTIVMVELVHGRLKPQRVLMLGQAQMSGVRTEGGRTTIGAMTPVAELESTVEPLATAARGVADPEIRAQATLGGNLCAPPGAESPRGDLQAALIALGARSAPQERAGSGSSPSRPCWLPGPKGASSSTSPSTRRKRARTPKSAGRTPTRTRSSPSAAPRAPAASASARAAPARARSA
jgi:hypothetical protein